ncbi:hypothetical protein [Pyrofollis japonicus]|uniref:hypothetical protein n=1 Tax=Pyrofollis japonicus TaxID=3060460 RepID=UPI00295AB5A2|nr:hypothetical protein [Pyrofollis japonicus]
MLLKAVSGAELIISDKCDEGNNINENIVVADLPITHPSKEYRGPYHTQVAETLSEIGTQLDTKSRVPVFADTNLPQSRIRCRPRLECLAASVYKPLDSAKNINTLYPKIVFPTILGWIRTRVRKPLVLGVPWLCAGRRGHYLNIICAEKLCTIKVNPDGMIKSLEGKAYYVISPSCNTVRLYIDYLVGNALEEYDRDDIEYKRPAVWSPSGLIPLSMLRDSNEDYIDLCLWNPYPVTKTHSIVLENHRIIEAYTYSVTINEWEPLQPLFNQVYINAVPYGLVRLRLRLRKIPPLLSRRKQ